MKSRILASGFVIAFFVTAAFGTPPPPAPGPRVTSAYISAAESYTDLKSCAFAVEIVTTGYGILHTKLQCGRHGQEDASQPAQGQGVVH